MDQCFLYHCGFNYEAIKDREWNFEANGCARPAVFAWNLLPHQHLLTRLGKEMDELTRLAEVDCLLTHLKMLSFLRKEDLDWGVSLLQVDNQEATKAEIRWQADYTILWWIFWVRKDRAKKKIRTRSAALCTVFAQKVAWAHFIYDPRFGDKWRLLGLLTDDSYDKNLDH